MRQVQVPWPQAADADAISSLACSTFRTAVQDKPFCISRVVLALQYCSGSATAPPASEKRKRSNTVPTLPEPAQQSILRFVGNSTPMANPLQDRPPVAAAATASVGALRTPALTARGGRVTLQSFFAPSRRANDAITREHGAAHLPEDARGSLECVRGVGGADSGRTGSMGSYRLGEAQVGDGADQREQKKISSLVCADVVVID